MALNPNSATKGKLRRLAIIDTFNIASTNTLKTRLGLSEELFIMTP